MITSCVVRMGKVRREGENTAAGLRMLNDRYEVMLPGSLEHNAENMTAA